MVIGIMAEGSRRFSLHEMCDLIGESERSPTGFGRCWPETVRLSMFKYRLPGRRRGVSILSEVIPIRIRVSLMPERVRLVNISCRAGRYAAGVPDLGKRFRSDDQAERQRRQQYDSLHDDVSFFEVPNNGNLEPKSIVVV